MSKRKENNIPLPNRTILKDYTIIRKISSGGFSFVYIAVSNITNETVAIKEYMPNSMKVRTNSGSNEIYIDNIKDKQKFNLGLKNFFQEMSVISYIKHNNIINIIDYFEANNTAYIVTPFEYGFPLSYYINNLAQENKFVSEEYMIKIVLGILEAIKELHDNNILHLDLKPANIWLRPNKEVVIIDFGTSLEKNKVRTKQFFYSAGFAAIEQYKKYYKPLDLGVWTDYYGIGATIYQLLTLKAPTDSVKLLENNEQIDIFTLENGHYHYKILEVVNTLCQIDVKERKKINIVDIINQVKSIIPFNYQNESLENILANRPEYVEENISFQL